MVNILALEAASESCSVTLKTPSINEHIVIKEARSHSQHFLPCIRSLLEQQSFALADVNVIACGNGPGSFTGLRICFAMAQGLAYGLNLPLITVPSLTSMAYLYCQHRQSAREKVISVLDARMGEVYLGEFEASVDGVMLVDELQLLSLEAAQSFVAETLHGHETEFALVGPGVALLELPAEMPAGYSIDRSIQPHSSAVADIAAQQWAAGEASGASDAQICYLRNSVTWDKRKRLRS